MTLFLALLALLSYEVEVPLDEIPITEEFTVILHLTYPKNHPPDKTALRAHLTSHFDPGPPPFSLIDEESSLSGEEAIEETILYTLSPQIIGTKTLSFFSIPFKNTTETLVSNPFTIKVAPPKTVTEPKPAPLLPLSSPYPIQLRSENKMEWIDRLEQERIAQNRTTFEGRRFPWINLLLLALGLGALCGSYRLYEGRKVSPSQTASEKGLKKLKALEKLKLPQKGEFESFYLQVTEIVRTYIEEAYGVSAPTLTTEEFLHSLEKKPLLKKREEIKLAAFLILADKVKFAKHPSSEKECQDMLACAKSLTKTEQPE